MTRALLILGGVGLLLGVIALFGAPGSRGRLRGVLALATGALLVVLLAAPDRAQAALTVALSGATLAGLYVVAQLFERAAARKTGGDLRLDSDPLRRA